MQIRTRSVRAPALALAFVASACAHGRAGGVVETMDFPSRGDLSNLARASAPADLFKNAGAAATSWDLQGPFPASPITKLYSEDNGWQKLLREAVDEHPGMMIPSEAQHCVARELGRWHLANSQRPEQALMHDIRGRCQAVQPSLAFGSLDGEIPDGVDEAQVLEHFRPQVLELVEKLGSGTREVGLWYGREGKKATVYVTAAKRTANLVSARLPSAASPRVELDVEILAPAQYADGLTTKGRWDVGHCEATGTLPRLHFSCPVAANDPSSWLEIAAFPAGRLLGSAAMELLLFPAGTPQNRWVKSVPVRGAPVSADPELRAAFLEVLNAERARAGRAPLRLSPAESTSIAPLVSHYIASAYGHAPETDADEIALGVMAGWEVEGNVHRGAMAQGVAIGTNDAGVLLEEMLARPSSRETLFAPEVTHLAVGPLVSRDPQVMAVLVGTYELFDDKALEAETKKVLDVLTKARAARNFGPPNAIAQLGDKTRNVAIQLTSGRENVFDEFLNDASRELKLPTRAWAVETSDLEKIQFPDELLGPHAPAVSIGVAHHRVEGAPWGRYLVVIVTTSVGETTAANESRPEKLAAR